jgi:hypothetical protein
VTELGDGRYSELDGNAPLDSDHGFAYLTLARPSWANALAQYNESLTVCQAQGMRLMPLMKPLWSMSGSPVISM